MMRRLGCLLFIATLSGGAAAAQDAIKGAIKDTAKDAAKPFDATPYPAGVQQVLHAAREACKAAGGGNVTFAPDTVRAVNLTGGTHNDYIVDLRDAACQDHEGTYCGTGGCEIDIVVTLPSGGTRTVFSLQVRDYDVEPGSGARSIRFTLHGGYCGGHGNPSCIKSHLITTRPFAFKMPQ
jgi:hypothetical protein